jgi:hypothetical protein
MKIIYYLHWVATEDAESQQKGLVGVFWWPTTSGITPTKKQNTMYDSESEDSNAPGQHDGFAFMPGPRDHIVGARLFAGAPGRSTAIHICLPDKQVFHFFRSSLALGLNTSRRRIKVHTGRESTCRRFGDIQTKTKTMLKFCRLYTYSQAKDWLFNMRYTVTGFRWICCQSQKLETLKPRITNGSSKFGPCWRNRMKMVLVAVLVQWRKSQLSVQVYMTLYFASVIAICVILAMPSFADGLNRHLKTMIQLAKIEKLQLLGCWWTKY